MEQVVHKIQTGRRIYILGLRSSKVLAEYLAFYLNFIMDDVHVIPSGASDVLDKLVKINNEDVLITISFPRYSRRTFDVVRYAKAQGATLIGITDSMMSPLASLVDYTLTAKYNMTTFIDSLVAPMSLINALIIALSLNEKEKLKSTFDQLERIWEENEVYSKTK
jgi:DNA-binding MurR/RpiR family transcriptional regulator